MNSVVLVVENHLHSEKITRGVFSSTEKAWKHIELLEEINQDNAVTYGVEVWLVDYLIN